MGGTPPRQHPENPRYHELLDAGEAAEFARGAFAEAAALYGQAAAVAGADTGRRAEAWLREARTLRRGGAAQAARVAYRRVAALPASFRDEDGMPHALYAAEGLLEAGLDDSGAARGALDRLVTAQRALAPLALYALHDLAGRVNSGRQHLIANWIAVVERCRTLEREVPGLIAAAGRDSTLGAPTPWFAFGPEPLLVSAGAAAEARSRLVVVAAPAVVLQSLAAEGGPLAAPAGNLRLTTGSVSDAELLGSALPGLRGVFVDPAALGAGNASIGPRLLLVVLPLVAGLMVFAAWLLWRDVVREVATARLRSRIVASVSHDLKTPLTSIRLFAEMLLRKRQPPAARREYLTTILHESDRLTRFINNVLGFSRIEAGQQRYRFGPTDLGELAREAAHAMAYSMTEGGFDLQLDLSGDAPLVQADRNELMRAVLNLLSNAMKFSGDRRTITLSVAAQNGDALLQVRDQGRGIAPGDRERIFDPFFRAADVEQDSITGTGLGLPLVAHVVRAHGGRVEVESVPGVGSTFTIRLPLESNP